MAAALPVTIYCEHPETLTLLDLVTVYDNAPWDSFAVVRFADGRHGTARLQELAALLFPDAEALN